MNKDQIDRYKYENKVSSDNFEMIDIGKIKYDKPIAFIINPMSGRKVDQTGVIINKMNEHNIKYEFLVSKSQCDAIKIVKELDLDRFSALVAVGGDGTIHEVINGLLHRSDNKKIPLGFLPNGSGNDMCKSLELQTFEQGLQYLVKGDLIKTDVFEALLDHETVEEV